MNRIEKVKALQAIAAGRANIESLQPSQRFIFIEQDESPGIYMMAGSLYDVDQLFTFQESIKNTCHSITTITKHSPSRLPCNLTLNIN